MLPFLKPRSQTGITTTYRAPDESSQEQDKSDNTPLKACSDELLDAIHNKDAEGVARALTSAWMILESMEVEPTESME